MAMSLSEKRAKAFLKQSPGNVMLNVSEFLSAVADQINGASDKELEQYGLADLRGGSFTCGWTIRRLRALSELADCRE
jgi:hypothetical protein